MAITVQMICQLIRATLRLLIDAQLVAAEKASQNLLSDVGLKMQDETGGYGFGMGGGDSLNNKCFVIGHGHLQY